MSVTDVNLISEETGQQIADALFQSADAMGRIANKLGAYDLPTSWPELQAYIKTGRIGEICPVGTRLQVDKESSVSATAHGSITPSVVEDTFIDAIGHAGTAAYEFIYDGSMWHHNGDEVELINYGITYTGAAAADDTIVIHVTADKVDFTVVANDYDVPANGEVKHTLALYTTDLLLYGSIPFCPAQKLVSVREALPAGTYHITLDHGSYGSGTNQDSTYQFTTTQAIPAGGGIRHTTMGLYQGGGYTIAHIVYAV